MPVLYYEAGEGAGRKVEFADSVVLGRLRTAQVPIPDPEASREHTRVVREAGGWFAVDCGSRNGTEVNGSKVTRHALKTGDRIRIAKTVLRFEEGPSTDGGSESTSASGPAPASRPAAGSGAGVVNGKRPVDPGPYGALAPAGAPPVPPAAPPPVPSAAQRPSGRIAPPAPAAGVRPSGAHAPQSPSAPPPGPPRPHGPTGPSGAAQMAVYALLAALFVGLLFLSRWIAGVAIDRMVQNQRQEQPK